MNDDSFYWQPGATLPTPSNTRGVSRSTLPVYPGNHQLSPESESEPEEDTSLQSTLKAILSSQTALQKQMEEVLHRVNNLEESVKESSLSSSCSTCSSDERKQKKRLSSELCVSNFLLHQYLM